LTTASTTSTTSPSTTQLPVEILIVTEATSTNPSTVSQSKSFTTRRLPYTVPTKSPKKNFSKQSQSSSSRPGINSVNGNRNNFNQKSYQERKRQQERIRKLAKRRAQRIKLKKQRHIGMKTTKKMLDNKRILNHF
jgi:hypothetical protein